MTLARFSSDIYILSKAYFVLCMLSVFFSDLMLVFTAFPRKVGVNYARLVNVSVLSMHKYIYNKTKGVHIRLYNLCSFQ